MESDRLSVAAPLASGNMHKCGKRLHVDHSGDLFGAEKVPFLVAPKAASFPALPASERAFRISRLPSSMGLLAVVDSAACPTKFR